MGCHSYGCLFAGALGNTVDRILWVATDFINIQIIPVFNIADMLLNCGIAIILCQSLFELREVSDNVGRLWSITSSR